MLAQTFLLLALLVAYPLALAAAVLLLGYVIHAFALGLRTLRRGGLGR